MLTIKPLSDCTLEQSLQVWNEGFKGYFSDMTMTMDRYLQRFVHEGLTPDASVVAFDGKKPVGFVLNGIRTVNGIKISWNGGTGVVPEYRRKGVGRELVAASLEVYGQNDVDIAYLEAIAANETAIRLYERMGYRVTDYLTSLQHIGPLNECLFASSSFQDYDGRVGPARAVADLEFYRGMGPWQSQWQSISGGESLIVYDKSGDALGYALYRRHYDEAGKLVAIALYQCEAAPDRTNQNDVICYMLHRVYSPLEHDCRRFMVNILTSATPLKAALTHAKFTTLWEQVFMTRPMKARYEDGAESFSRI